MSVVDQHSLDVDGRQQSSPCQLHHSLKSKGDVVLLRWPGEGEKRRELEIFGTPRLLIVTPGAALPLSLDPLEDWVTPPIERQELAARIRQLQARADAHAAPVIDDFDVLGYAGHRLALSRVEARLMRALISSPGECIAREELMIVGWRDSAVATRNALNLHIVRLRRRISPLNLHIRTIWRRGYLLEARTATRSHERIPA